MADSSDKIKISITNNTGGDALIVLFYQGSNFSGDTAVSHSPPCALANNATSGCILSVDTADSGEYWAISVLVKDKTGAGYYTNTGDYTPLWEPWNECDLDADTYTLTVSTTQIQFVDSGGNTDGLIDLQLAAPRPDADLPAISHVFVVMLENRSFDHMLAFSGIPNIVAATTADKNTYMIMDAANRTDRANKVQTAALDRVGEFGPQVCHVHIDNVTSMPTDPGHEFPDVVTQLCGEFATFDKDRPYPPIDNSGFLASYATSTTEYPNHPPTSVADLDKIMACFDTQNDLPILHTLAANFAVCDHWFASMPGPTWPNRFFLHAASSAGFDHSPSNTDMKYWEAHDPALQFANGTIFDQLTNLKINYRLYQDYQPDIDGSISKDYSCYSDDPSQGGVSGAVPQAGAFENVSALSFFALTNDDPSAPSGLATDLQGPYPYPYTFIEPHYGDIYEGTYQGGSSQHPMDEVYGGENLLKGVYEAISNSPYWQSSLLVICYDEHGGFYDSAPPPKCTPPGDGTIIGPDGYSSNQYGFDFSRLGVRVPAVLVSPLITSGTVCNTVFDHSCVSKMLSQLWGTQTMTERDANAASPLKDSWWLSTPRTDDVTLPPLASPTGSATRLSKTERVARLAEPLPASGNEIGTLFVLRKMDREMAKETGETVGFEWQPGVTTRGDAQDYARRVLDKARQLGFRGRKQAKTRVHAPLRETVPAEPQ